MSSGNAVDTLAAIAARKTQTVIPEKGLSI